MSQDEVSSQAVAHFKPVSVRAMTDALPFPLNCKILLISKRTVMMTTQPPVYRRELSGHVDGDT